MLSSGALSPHRRPSGVLGSPNRQPFGSPNKIPTAQSMQLDQLLTAALGGEALAAGATEVLPVPTVAGDDGQRDAHVANSRRRFLESLSTCTSFFEHCPTCYNVRSSSREACLVLIDLDADYSQLEGKSLPTSGPHRVLFCHHCDKPDGHHLVQVRRNTHCDVIRAADLAPLYPITGIQTYSINCHRVIFLQPRPNVKITAFGTAGTGQCIMCSRTLLEPSSCFCSLACKLGFEQRGSSYAPLMPQVAVLQQAGLWPGMGIGAPSFQYAPPLLHRTASQQPAKMPRIEPAGAVGGSAGGSTGGSAAGATTALSRSTPRPRSVPRLSPARLGWAVPPSVGAAVDLMTSFEPGTTASQHPGGRRRRNSSSASGPGVQVPTPDSGAGAALPYRGRPVHSEGAGGAGAGADVNGFTHTPAAAAAAALSAGPGHSGMLPGASVGLSLPAPVSVGPSSCSGDDQGADRRPSPKTVEAVAGFMLDHLRRTSSHPTDLRQEPGTTTSLVAPTFTASQPPVTRTPYLPGVPAMPGASSGYSAAGRPSIGSEMAVRNVQPLGTPPLAPGHTRGGTSRSAFSPFSPVQLMAPGPVQYSSGAPSTRGHPGNSTIGSKRVSFDDTPAGGTPLLSLSPSPTPMIPSMSPAGLPSAERATRSSSLPPLSDVTVNTHQQHRSSGGRKGPPPKRAPVE